jgi:hypothetical protein
MQPHRVKAMLTVILAIIAALLVSLLLFYGRAQAPSVPLAQPPSLTDELKTVDAMTPPPASNATVARESQTLNTVSKTFEQSNPISSSDQDKIGVLLQTHQTGQQTQ